MESVIEFYRGKTVFITGGSGFMGKVLLEKLLRSCPGVAKLYVLLRPKRQKDVSERLEMLKKTQIFDYLKKTDPAQLDKLVAIPGDIMQPELGISSKDRAILEEEVSIIFHSAATVKFDEILKVSVDMNVKGTMSMLNLAKRMKKLEALIHVSTAYCNCDRSEVDEVIYPCPGDPKKIVQMVEWLDEDIIADITPKLLQAANRPNTYTYTKALAESLVASEHGDVPVAIIRPSIVTCAWREPVPGWVDNLNGPTGMVVCAGKGVLRSVLCHDDMVADVVPVDIPINLMITAAWHTAVRSPNELQVYNCTSSSICPVRWRELLVWGEQELVKNPMCNVLWYPGGNFTSSPTKHKIAVMFLHFLPAYVLDALIMLAGHKPLLVRIQKRIRKAAAALTYFTTNQWIFSSSNVKSLLAQMPEQERDIFRFDMKEMNWKHYMGVYCIGVRRFILKEDGSIESCRRHLKRMWFAHQAVKLLFFLATSRLIYNRSATLRSLCWSLVAFLRSVMPWLAAYTS